MFRLDEKATASWEKKSVKKRVYPAHLGCTHVTKIGPAQKGGETGKEEA